MKSKAMTNFIYNSFYQLLTIILPLVTAPYISRILGAEGIGIYSYTYSIADYFVLFEMLGVKNYGNRCCAAVQGDKKALGKAFINIYAMQFLISCFVLIAYIVYAGMWANYRVAAIFQVLYVLSGMLDISWFFFGIEKFKMTTVRSTIVKVISVLMIFLLVKDANDVVIYIIIIGASMLVSQLTLWPFIRRELEWCKPSWREVIKHLIPNLVLFIPVVAVSLYKIMDKIMLGKISTMSQSGLYENAEKIINIPMSLITSLGTVMLPRMSNLAASGDVEQSKDIIHKSMLFVMFLGSAMTFGILGIANSFIPLFYGSDFTGCIIVVVLLAPTILFISWANVIRTQYLLPNKMDKPYIVTVFAGAAVNLVINACLIPSFGAAGAAMGTLVAELVVAMLQTMYVSRYLPIKLYLKEGLVCVFIGLGMYFCVKAVEAILTVDGLLLVLVQVAVGVVVYCVLAAACTYKMNKEMFRYCRSFLDKREK